MCELAWNGRLWPHRGPPGPGAEEGKALLFFRGRRTQVTQSPRDVGGLLESRAGIRGLPGEGRWGRASGRAPWTTC